MSRMRSRRPYTGGRNEYGPDLAAMAGSMGGGMLSFRERWLREGNAGE